MKNTYIVAAATFLAATAAFAHSGVKNAAVKARMDAMSAVGAEMKTLGMMAKGASTFNADTAKAAAAAIADHASDAPDLFRANENDPKSEAKPAIWENFQDFTAKAVALETVARDLSMSIQNVNDLGPALSALGDTCKACHGDYREKN